MYANAAPRLLIPLIYTPDFSVKSREASSPLDWLSECLYCFEICNPLNSTAARLERNWTTLNTFENLWDLTNEYRNEIPKCPHDRFKCTEKHMRYFKTLYVLNFQWESKHIFTFCVISPRWCDADGWNPSSNKTRIYLFYRVNSMAADVLAT